MSQILSNGSLKLKVVVTSGEDNPDKINKLGNSVLGHGWEPKRDIITIGSSSEDFAVCINPSTQLTPRTILGVVNKPHDLIGLSSPLTICLRAAYRDLFKLNPPLEWDDPVPSKTQNEWIALTESIKKHRECRISKIH